jgi:glutathione synthase/RimK-type ligase-like ATP-grasp enzyme
MKKVLILFGKSQWKKSKPFSNKKYMYSYEYFYMLCKKNRIQMYRASYQWYDPEKNIFKYAWIFEGKNGNWKRVFNVKPDLIYDKTKYSDYAYHKNSRICEKYPFFNSLEFTRIIDNKLATSLLFKEWSKKSLLVNDNSRLKLLFKKIPARKKMVLKPIGLSGGENVLIGNKKEILNVLSQNKIIVTDWLLQEFIDSSAGIAKIMSGTHDFRLVIINNEIIYAYYRRPAEGSLLANLAQGGTMKIVDLKKLPVSIFPIFKKACELFSGFEHKIYTIDLMFDKQQKPWIVELNSMPGMYFEKGQEKMREHFYKKLLTTFKNL